MTHCPKCGVPVDQGTRFCPACGTPAGGAGTPQPHRSGRALKLWALAGLACFACLIIMAINFNLFLRLVAIGGTVLFMLSIAMMFLTFRKAKKIAPAPLVISIIMSLLTLWVYALFLGIHFSGTVKFMGLLSGILVGIGWALTTPVRSNNGIVEREGNVWYLVVWGLVFAINQLAAAITGRPPHIAMVLLLLGTGIVLGTSGTFIARYYSMKARH
ncbi:MAG: zinc ribbon domain-containing protein [Kiritimatiellaeota bacterium]|nr:zinc ribbon domain-containing protein [Kiritimatiellota bacterium]